MIKPRVSEDLESGIIVLCGEKGCCPVVDLTNPNKVVLRDDLGGRVQLKREQWADLLEKFSRKKNKK